MIKNRVKLGGLTQSGAFARCGIKLIVAVLLGLRTFVEMKVAVVVGITVLGIRLLLVPIAMS
jgi:hypothetical protein